jgi:hypothetical protein
LSPAAPVTLSPVALAAALPHHRKFDTASKARHRVVCSGNNVVEEASMQGAVAKLAKEDMSTRS